MNIRDSYSEQTRPEKAALQQMIASKIYFDKKGIKSQQSTSVITLGGPSIDKCFSIYQKLVGRHGSVHSIERDKKVFRRQKKFLTKVGDQPLNLHHGDFCRTLEGLVSANKIRAKSLYIEMDVQGRLDKIFAENNYWLGLISQQCKRFQDEIWLSITYSRRGICKSDKEKLLHRIASIFRNKTVYQNGWSVKHIGTYHYNDTSNMGLTLWKCVRK